MGIGKILGFAALGVGAIAAAPFTGGGSIVGAVSLAGSLAGAGALAAGAGVVGVGVGIALSEEEEKKKKEQDAKEAEWNLKAEKYEKALRDATFRGDKEYFNYIISATAIGIAIANADNHISKEEKAEIEAFIGGIVASTYPEWVKNTIKNLYINIPNFNSALMYLSKINPSNYGNIRDLLKLVMMADGVSHEKELAFIKAFDIALASTKYEAEPNDTEKVFLLQLKR